MLSVREWLNSLGLSEYTDRFAENRIDFSILSDLTDQDLKELGIVLGDRRRLLRAIAELGRIAPAPKEAAAPVSAAPMEAERRHVTVMFSDLVDSTGLSVRMDPEDLREIISVYQKCVTNTVRRFGGFVARLVGDGALVYFGYPEAHEDDAERAVQAGLELIGAVSGLASPQQVRVGIATGLVVVGHLISTGESEERGIVGETPNLAARLQGIAEPNMLVIADNTRRLLGDLFDLQDLGARNLKGIGAPVRAWAVLQSNSIESRFEALRQIGLTTFIGREKESEILVRQWEKAKKREGQVVLISGEAGIGKSRLTAEFMRRLAGEPHARLRYFCSPQHTDSALHPFIDQMRRAAEFARDDTVKVKLDKLDALLKRTDTSEQDAALIAEMLSLPNDGRYPTVELAPQHRRERTLEALFFQLEALTRSDSVLVIFEDAQWADPTSLELLRRTVTRITAYPVLLEVTFRPEFELHWNRAPHIKKLALGRLPPHDSAAIVDQIIGTKPLPTSIRKDIIERTDGIPLYVEEMTKAIMEADSQSAAEHIITATPSPELTVPATLHASLMSRLDRLGPAKELAQVGAAIGRGFSYPLLAAVLLKPKAELLTALDSLIQAGLLFRQGYPPNANYFFKHALIRDVAYSTLLRASRRALHANIAQTLERQFAEIAENQPEVLARHWTEASEIERAVEQWGKAGQRSLQRSALAEAEEQLTRALDQIATLPPSPALRREEIKFQVALITPLLHVRGYAASETKHAVERARLLIERAEALGEAPEDPLLLFSVLYALWVANLVAFKGEVMRELARQFLALANKQEATGPVMLAHRLMGLSLIHTGEITGGREHLDRAITLYEPSQHRPLATRFGQDVGAASLSWKSIASWLLGYPEAAVTDAERALQIAREVGHSATLMYTLNFSAWVEIWCGNYTKANELFEEFSVLKDQIGSVFWGAWGKMQRGCLLALTGKAFDAVQTITSGITEMRSTETTMWMPVWLSYASKASAEIGEFDAARHFIREAMLEATRERWYEAEANRIAGEIALSPPEPDVKKAEFYFERALAVAKEQRAKAWEIRAVSSRARLWRDNGKPHEGYGLLAPVYGWFTQGLDTRDLKETKQLLDELAQYTLMGEFPGSG